MRGSRLLIGLLLLATVLADCAVLAWAVREPGSFFRPILTWALQLSQVSLMAVWLALGRTSAPLRLMGVIAIVALWSWAMATLRFGPRREEWVILLTAQTLAVGVPLLVARFAGVRLEVPSPAAEAEDSPTRPRTWQFSIGYLLAWMTALAFMLGTLQYIAPYQRLRFALLLESDVWECVLGAAVVALTVLWTVLAVRQVDARFVVACGVLGVLIVTLAFFLGSFQRLERELLTALLLQVVPLAGSLGVFRMAGYRLLLAQGKPIVPRQ